MSHPDVARLREIKRLLDRIQQLPNIAGIPNGLPNGFHPGASMPAPAQDEELEPMLPPLDRGAPPPLDRVAPSPLDRFLPPPLDRISPSPLDRIASAPLDAPRREGLPRDDSRALVLVQPKSGGGMSPWMFVVATAINAVVAAALAVVITLGMARREATLAPAPAEAVVASIKPAADTQADPPPLQPVELLPVGSPGEPLRLEAAKPARLPLQIRPDEANQESYILILSGLPANAALSGASRMGADSWLVPPGALHELEVVVPEWSTSTIEVGVELRRTNGAVAAQTKLWLAVPPPATPRTARLSDTALADLVRNGDRLLDRGDVTAARALYEKAAAMGSAQAALALGSTYDPRRLWSLGVFGAVGNKERARHWYQRAAELGHPDAKERIRALK